MLPNPEIWLEIDMLPNAELWLEIDMLPKCRTLVRDRYVA